jgi:hypothetical protein
MLRTCHRHGMRKRPTFISPYTGELISMLTSADAALSPAVIVRGGAAQRLSNPLLLVQCPTHAHARMRHCSPVHAGFSRVAVEARATTRLLDPPAWLEARGSARLSTRVCMVNHDCGGFAAPAALGCARVM